MSSTNLKRSTYVPTENVRFLPPVSIDRRQFLARAISGALRVAGNSNLTAETSILVEDVVSSLPKPTFEYAPFDDLTPIEKAARRLMMVASSAKEGTNKEFTEEEIIGLAFDAGCDFVTVEDSYGFRFLPTQTIQVERMSDGRVSVYEGLNSQGIILEALP